MALELYDLIRQVAAPYSHGSRARFDMSDIIRYQTVLFHFFYIIMASTSVGTHRS